MGLPQSCPLPGPVLHQHSLDVKINTSCLVELPCGPPHPGWGESLLPISILTLQAEWSVTLGGPGAPCLWGQLALIRCPWRGESVPAVENCSESNRKKWWTELPCLCSWLRSPPALPASQSTLWWLQAPAHSPLAHVTLPSVPAEPSPHHSTRSTVNSSLLQN